MNKGLFPISQTAVTVNNSNSSCDSSNSSIYYIYPYPLVE